MCLVKTLSQLLQASGHSIVFSSVLGGGVKHYSTDRIHGSLTKVELVLEFRIVFKLFRNPRGNLPASEVLFFHHIQEMGKVLLLHHPHCMQLNKVSIIFACTIYSDPD